MNIFMQFWILFLLKKLICKKNSEKKFELKLIKVIIKSCIRIDLNIKRDYYLKFNIICN